MAKVKTDSTQKSRPAISPESRENQMISLAVDLAEKQLRDGTASSQVITHFLKLATVQEKLKNDKLIAENKLLKAKADMIESQERSEELYANAIKAMKNYMGQGEPDEY